ncbi:unnamed protein product [Soboliphyme baturini]|uniref:Uncharacterized protein n=1 Tax=Soboliphyme baturini TaxID=241478 RepID=A0A183INV4_9BILA|nr:unnamed protein product [Soboliphyme baturini]
MVCDESHSQVSVSDVITELEEEAEEEQTGIEASSVASNCCSAIEFDHRLTGRSWRRGASRCGDECGKPVFPRHDLSRD